MRGKASQRNTIYLNKVSIQKPVWNCLNTGSREKMMTTYFDQHEYDLRCEWGLEGINQLADSSDAIIIVDVISFTTCVDVALSSGTAVYPYRWKDESALAFAESMGAILAISSRRDREPGRFSLSPLSLTHLPEGAKIVLPSPNGSTLSLATGTVPTFAGCLRNASAVAAAAAALGRRISLIPAGERWKDNTLRPALEDLIGAGAILNALPGTRSPEAEAAVITFRHFKDRLLETLSACGSGKEAADRGKGPDLPYYVDLDCSPRVPRLVDGAYRL